MESDPVQEVNLEKAAEPRKSSENIYQPQEDQKQAEEPPKELFKTSQIEQPEALKTFFAEKLAIPYNKFCIDCQTNLTTHCIIWLGSFVCTDCAKLHLETWGGMQNIYIKNVHNEQWDDYQLRSVCLGGNQPLFEIFREYGIVKENHLKKYKHACVRWYRNKHLSDMDSVPYTIPKPPKDWDERVKQMKEELKDSSQTVQKNLQQLGNQASENTTVASSSLKFQALSLKEKIKSKEYGKRLMGMFAKKNQQPQGESQDKEKEEGE